MVVKRRPKRKPTRREARTIPIYGTLGPVEEYYIAFKRGQISEGKPDPLHRLIGYHGEVVPQIQQVGSATYHFYKRVTLRGTVKKIINQLRKQGYKARNFQVKRHIGRRAIVVDNVIYTRPRHPNASRNR